MNESHSSRPSPLSIPNPDPISCAQASEPALNYSIQLDYSTNIPYRSGQWTDKERLRYLMARNVNKSGLDEIVKLLYPRTKNQIRSHEQKVKKAITKSTFHKLQAQVRLYLEEKLNLAYDQPQYEQIPSSLLVSINPNLLQDFKNILGSKINSNYVITRKDMEYVGIKLLRDEWKKLHEFEVNETRETEVLTPCIIEGMLEMCSNEEAKGPNRSRPLNRENAFEFPEMEEDANRLPRGLFSIFHSNPEEFLPFN